MRLAHGARRPDAGSHIRVGAQPGRRGRCACVGGGRGGAQFILHLKQFSDSLLSRTQELNEQLDDLVGSVKVWSTRPLVFFHARRELSGMGLAPAALAVVQFRNTPRQSTDFRIINTFNEFLMLANNQFIENVRSVVRILAHLRPC